MVNQDAQRFGNETQGYSEFAVEALRQPGKQGYLIFDQEIHDQLLSIEHFKNLAELKAFKSADLIQNLAEQLHIDPANLQKTLEQFQQNADQRQDDFGRQSFPKKMAPPFYGIKVVPALFHTQGGLKINKNAQVINKQAEAIRNLYAGGGAAVGVSGNHAYGYMSGNGLLAALGFGKIAGDHSANTILQEGSK
jgi:fumarate reductase flavoprotein subunit